MSDSFTIVEAEWLKTKIATKLQEIEQTRQCGWQQLITDHRQKRRLLHILFPWLRTQTDEEIKHKIRRSRWFTPDSYCWGTERVMNRLEQLITMSKDGYIMIGADDASHLE